tara:strand:- start:169 stop:447 length:279 start_codon:yes stop_codon:yes gene_type:complete
MDYHRNIGLDSLEYEFDLNPRTDKEEEYRSLVIRVRFFPRSKHPTHFDMRISHYDKEQHLAEELSLEQLERLHGFIGLVLKLSKNKKESNNV